MRLSQHIILSIFTLLAFGSVAVSDEIDPFSDNPPPQQQQAPPKEFETTGVFKVAPAVGGNPESIPSEDWPKIEMPTSFNRHFDRPLKIWRVDGGYFGAFDGGEWGGALFFAVGDEPKWTRIIDTHIQDLERFEGDTFLATGGLAHLSLSGGSAYLITRLPTGEWQARMIFSSEIGIPRVAGTSATDAFLKAESKKLIVLGLEYPLGSEPLFGVDVTGAIHYLGERAKNKPSEQGGAGQPATAPESKPAGVETPKPESETTPR
jgi:hypothetical protein